MATRDKPGFFYEGGGRSKVLHQIHHCVRHSPGVMVLAGPTGSGRSLLLRRLVDSINNNNDADLCFLSDDSVVLETEEEVFRALAEGFGLEQKPIEIVENLMDRVEHFIDLGLSNKRSILIVIDDIKQHTDTVLDALLQLAHNFNGLSLLLSGESSLVDSLQDYDQRLRIQQINLRPLLSEEAFDFVRQYLQHQGVVAEHILDHTNADELMIHTGGNLCLLMREAQELMSSSRTPVSHLQTAWSVAHAAAFVAVIIVTVLAFFYYPQGHDANLLQVEPVTTQASEHEKQIMDEQVSLPSVLAETASQAEMHEPAFESAEHSNPTEQLYSVQEQELLSRPASNMTLQVMNLSSEKMLKDFVGQSGIADPDLLRYYRRGEGAQASYVLLYGNYPDKQKAMAAQKTLPAVFTNSAPWPRSLRDIQRELQERQQ